MNSLVTGVLERWVPRLSDALNLSAGRDDQASTRQEMVATPRKQDGFEWFRAKFGDDLEAFVGAEVGVWRGADGPTNPSGTPGESWRESRAGVLTTTLAEVVRQFLPEAHAGEAGVSWTTDPPDSPSALRVEATAEDGSPASLYIVLLPGPGADSPYGLEALGAGRKARGSNDVLAALLDVDLPVSVCFGSTQMQLRDLLKLTAGSVVELDRGVQDPVEVRLNNAVIARGEVVAVSGNYGVRIREIVRREQMWQAGIPGLGDSGAKGQNV